MERIKDKIFLTDALENLYLSCLAYYPSYKEAARIKKLVDKKGYTYDMIEDVGTDTQVYMIFRDGVTTISFRGTEQKKRDVLTDVLAIKTPWGAHAGFLWAFRSVEGKILKYLENRSKKVRIVGHSLGGALATLAAWKLRNKADIESVWAYGSPRVFGPIGALRFKALKIKLNRFVHENDWPSYLPPKRLGSGWCHVGEEYYLTTKDKIYKNPNKLVKGVDKFRDILKTGINQIPDHEPRFYEDCFIKNI